MDFQDLEEFLTIARMRSFSRAADSLYTTEATISRHIKKLENEIGSPLFIRSTRSVELTAMGKALIPCAEHAMELQEDINGTIRQVMQQEYTQLNIASVPVMETYIRLQSLIHCFQDENPRIQINLMDVHSEINSMLLGNVCDIGFSSEAHYLEDPRFSRVLITKDRLIGVFPEKHPLVKRKHIAIEDLKKEKLILISKGTPMNRLCIQLCQLHNFRPIVAMTVPNGTQINTPVKNGLGIGLLMKGSSIPDDQDSIEKEGLIYRTLDPPVWIDIDLIFLRNTTKSAQLFISFFKKHVNSYRI